LKVEIKQIQATTIPSYGVQLLFKSNVRLPKLMLRFLVSSVTGTMLGKRKVLEHLLTSV
jgi:hypothetical protein